MKRAGAKGGGGRRTEDEKEDKEGDPFTFIEALRARGAKPTDAQGEETGGEFVYLTYRDSSSYNPYKLRIVPYSKVDPADYFTMSAAGVAHFVHGGAEFTPLEQWEHESKLYSVLMDIPLLRMYRLWKTYTTWKRNYRSSAMTAAAKALSEGSFLLH
jgi:dynein heavy chain